MTIMVSICEHGLISSVTYGMAFGGKGFEEAC